MALPSLEHLTALDLLRIMDNYEEVALLLALHRMGERKPLQEFQADDLLWFLQLSRPGVQLREALKELSVDDIISFWKKKTHRKNSRGRPRKNTSQDSLFISALAELSPDDIIDFWIKKAHKKKDRGRPHEEIYMVAWMLKMNSKKNLMQVYRELVLPYLLEAGWMTRTPEGDPNPDQDKDEQKKFFNAMERNKKKWNKFSS